MASSPHSWLGNSTGNAWDADVVRCVRTESSRGHSAPNLDSADDVLDRVSQNTRNPSSLAETTRLSRCTGE